MPRIVSGSIPPPASTLGNPQGHHRHGHKLARIVWHLLKHRQAFNPEVFPKKRNKSAARNSPASKHRRRSRLSFDCTPMTYTACFPGVKGGRRVAPAAAFMRALSLELRERSLASCHNRAHSGKAPHIAIDCHMAYAVEPASNFLSHC